MKSEFKAVVFDIGNVFIRWDPENLYKKLIPDDEKRQWFLSTVCPMEWNLEQDRGRPWSVAVAEKTSEFPQYAELIQAYDSRWEEMLGGEIIETREMMFTLKQEGVPLYAITNFSSEKFEEAKKIYPYLAESFIDTVVSAEEKLLKPDPAIYQSLISRNNLKAGELIFIDDNLSNVEAARGVGMGAIHFKSPSQVRAELKALGFPL
ncbi:HAD family hydrolase [Polycladidibacter stylochi]|uniref:HAD family hydrolase n=1 Tax=Polycladidibacter stylochi TaxID=1807766 RepID=UPI00082E3E99|nr:HAD family phosphatase [Pseudovibrio stylochi]